ICKAAINGTTNLGVIIERHLVARGIAGAHKAAIDIATGGSSITERDFITHGIPLAVHEADSDIPSSHPRFLCKGNDVAFDTAFRSTVVICVTTMHCATDFSLISNCHCVVFHFAAISSSSTFDLTGNFSLAADCHDVIFRIASSSTTACDSIGFGLIGDRHLVVFRVATTVHKGPIKGISHSFVTNGYNVACCIANTPYAPTKNSAVDFSPIDKRDLVIHS